MSSRFDAAIVGSGPNGLAAAITLARAGESVVILEAYDRPGGGCRTAELTLPGFRHDVCSAVHPLAAMSAFFRDLDLPAHGVELVNPAIPLAHMIDRDHAVTLQAGVGATADGFESAADARRWRRLFENAAAHAQTLVDGLLRPVPDVRHPLLLAPFGLRALRSVESLCGRFSGDEAPALLAGLAAHAMVPLDSAATSGIALMLATIGQAAGWPLVRGGSEELVRAMLEELRNHDVEIRCGVQVRSMDDIPPARAVLFDTTPAQLLEIAGDELPARYRAGLERFPRGAGVFKLDYALSGPIPWGAEAARRAGTVHLGGTMAGVARAEADVARGRHADRPFCLVVQPTVADAGRAPAGGHVAWVYCHVPNGSTLDMTDALERRIEEYAPGFRDLILGRHVMNPAQLEAYNANYLGGDIGAGRQDLAHLFTRPLPRVSPYTTPNERLFLCSASTPPGGGVHGMCGVFAARAALRGVLRSR